MLIYFHIILFNFHISVNNNSIKMCLYDFYIDIEIVIGEFKNELTTRIPARGVEDNATV